MVRDQQSVDLLGPRRLRRRGDADGVASTVAGVPGVNQEVLAGGRNDQGGLPPFDIDEINIERFGGPGGDGHSGQQSGEQNEKPDGGNFLHSGIVLKDGCLIVASAEPSSAPRANSVRSAEPTRPSPGKRPPPRPQPIGFPPSPTSPPP